jgi:hypothetical protein
MAHIASHPPMSHMPCEGVANAEVRLWVIDWVHPSVTSCRRADTALMGSVRPLLFTVTMIRAVAVVAIRRETPSAVRPDDPRRRPLFR